jgi:gluconolactonase
MRATAVLVTAALLCGTWILSGQQQAPAARQQPQTAAPQRSRVAANDMTATGIPNVVAEGTRVQVIKRDFEVAINGPIGLPDGSGVLVAEILRNRVWKFDNNNSGTVLIDGSSGALCLAFDLKGRLIANQTMPAERNKIAVIYPKGQEAVLADNFEGRPFGRPNDLVVNRAGGIYFTDPGPNEGQIKIGHPKTDPAVYYVPPGGKAMKVAIDIPDPNGLVLSPDERTLYIADTSGAYVYAYQVGADGRLSNRRNFAQLGEEAEAEADGMAIDNDGRLYVSVWGGVEVFDAQGRRLGLIPGSGPGNLAFGGPDRRTLYITGGTSLSRVNLLAQGPKGRAK